MEIRGLKSDIEISLVENGWLLVDKKSEMIGNNSAVYVFTDDRKLIDFLVDWMAKRGDEMHE